MVEECSLECGQEDIIGSGGGSYHLKEWVDARVAGVEPEAKAAAPRAEAAPALPPKGTGEPELNERQAWILEQVRKGVQLKRQDIIRHTKKNRSTINRDIKELREAGLVGTHPDGHYVAPRSR
jgi:vacuolar-type H+-ATPase subunit H